MSLKSLLIGAVMVAVGGAVPACATEYLQNGSFENTDPTGKPTVWIPSGDQTLVFVVNGIAVSYVTGAATGNVSQGAQEGSNYLLEGPTGADAFLSQTFTATAGMTLTISGWVTGAGPVDDPTAPPEMSDVQFLFNGVVLGSVNPVPDQIWTQYVFTAVAKDNNTFSVGFRNDNTFDGLDNFSVSSVSAVPEPATWALLLLGFAGLGLVRYRRWSVAEVISS